LNPADKRQFVRLPIHVDFTVEDESSDESGNLYFASKNVSIGGAFLVSDFLLEKGTQVSVHFQLPGEKPIHAKAKVAWVNDEEDSEPGMGIAFTAIAPESVAAIQRFIERLPVTG
jgi:uncharacterized protein (TIGR02266 family)